MSSVSIPVYFHESQLLFNPPFEWDKRGFQEHPESPDRPKAILKVLEQHPKDFDIRVPQEQPEMLIHQTHISDITRLYHVASERLEEKEYFFPTFFPKVHQRDVDTENLHNSGFYCFDTSTPLSKYTLESASWSAASAYAAADTILKEESRLSYGLSRPPGHHADKNYFGGYCYLNNAAIAATHLSQKGHVAILDIDFHHGDGTQSIFYYDCHILTTSIHADPVEFFPYFSGFANEIGLGAGENFNLNVPMPSNTKIDHYIEALETVIFSKIKAFDPQFLVVSAGLDTYKDDPIGGLGLETEDYYTIGKAVGRLGYPIAVVQEGGYFLPRLGENVKSLLYGLRDGLN